jgi:hypothetical protein
MSDKGVRFASMARKTRTIRSTAKEKGTTESKAPKEEPTTSKSEKNEEDWGPLGTAAKKVAKGALKGAAKEITKK